MFCYHKSKFDIPLFTEEEYLNLGQSGAEDQNGVKKNLALLRKKLKLKENISRKPIAKRLIPRCIKSEMKETLGKAEPEECGMFDDVQYPDPTNVVQHLIMMPTIWDEGKKNLELIIGTKKRRFLTIEEFSARKRTTTSLIKLLKNAVIKMQILLAVDHYEVTRNEKDYFSRRLRASKATMRQDMMNSIPDIKTEELQRVRRQRSAFMRGINKELEEEISSILKLKEDFLSRCFEFQVRWIMQDISDTYLQFINKYSIEWRDKLKKLEIQTEERVQEYKEQSKAFTSDYLTKLAEEVGRKWEDMIRESKREVFEKINEMARDAIFCDAQIETEKRRKKKILQAIEKSSAIIKSILTQFEKLVTFGFKGKPGVCNYFLSFQRLKELNEYLSHKEKLAVVEQEKSPSPKKPTEESFLEPQERSMQELTRENPSLELQRFRECIDKNKVLSFREKVLGMKQIAQEVRCYVINLTEERHLEVSPMPLSHYRADSTYIADKLTNAYRLAEDAYRKGRHKVAAKSRGSEHLLNKRKSQLLADSYHSLF